MSSIWSASSSTKISTLVEPDMALLEMVDEPAGRGDENVDAARQRLALGADADAAVRRPRRVMLRCRP